VPPVNAGVLTPMSGWLAPASVPWNVIVTGLAGSGPPAHTTLPAPMVDSASSAAWIAADVAL
jgi:hypothetical protein